MVERKYNFPGTKLFCSEIPIDCENVCKYPVLSMITAHACYVVLYLCNSSHPPPPLGATYTRGVAKVPVTDATQGSKRTWSRALYMDMWCTHERISARSRVGTSVGAGRCYRYVPAAVILWGPILVVLGNCYFSMK